MNKTITRKIILLALIAALLCVYIVQLCSAGKNNVQTVSLAETPDSILIVRGSEAPSETNSYRLVYENSSWFAGSKKYPADSSTVTKMADSIKNIKLLGEITKDPEAASEKYGLSENDRLTVTAFKDGKALRTVVVGKDTAAGGQSYIQVDGKKAVYLAEGAFHTVYGATLDAVRSKDVYTVAAADIISASVSLPEGKYTLQKSIPQADISSDTVTQATWSVSENTILENAELDADKVTGWINTLATLKASTWAADNEPLKSENLDSTAVINAGGKQYSVSIYHLENAEDARYLVKCSASPYPFYVTKYNGDKYKKNITDLIKK